MAIKTLLFLFWTGLSSLQVHSKRLCPSVNLQHGQVQERPPGVWQFKCHRGFVLQGHARLQCTQPAEEMPMCIRDDKRPPYGHQNDQPVQEEVYDEDQYGDYYDYDYDDYDDEGNYDDDGDYEDENYTDYDSPTDLDYSIGDDEDYYTMEGSGDSNSEKVTSSPKPETATNIKSTTTTTVTTSTTTITTTMTTTTTTTTTMKKMVLMTSVPIDDEDFYEGSGSGIDEEEADHQSAVEDMEEGSGDFYITPQEVDTLRRSFYSQHEVDLLRLDTSCKEKFISAPQIFHAKLK